MPLEATVDVWNGTATMMIEREGWECSIITGSKTEESHH